MAVAAAAAGVGLQAYGMYKQSQAQKEAAEANAEARRIQSQEMLERFYINREAIIQKTQSLKELQKSQYAKGGVDISSGSPLVMLEDTHNAMVKEINMAQHEMNYQQMMAQSDINTSNRLASNIGTAGTISTLGTLAGGAANLWMAKGNTGSNTGVP